MIYLDCAATSLQKPRSVHLAVQRAMQTMASPGRGGHRPAMRAADVVFSCREAVAELFHVPAPEQVVFTCNATHALNIAICSLAEQGKRAVVSGYEHNSVMRPLYEIGADVEIVCSPLYDSSAMVEGFDRSLPGATVAICTAMSNVFGFVTPIDEIADLCRQYGVPLIVDASQLAGGRALDFQKLGAAYVAMPGHKGLLGPQGTGVLLCGEMPKVWMAGGTGSESKLMTMPELLPDRAEAGTHNVPGIAGLEAGVRYILERGVDALGQHEYTLAEAFAEMASRLPGTQVFFEYHISRQSGVVSLRHESIDCEVLAERLGQAGIAVRGGMHCAPAAHSTAGTFDTGTVRFSFSPFNTPGEVKHAAAVLKQLTK